MLVSPIKTHKILVGENLMEIVEKYICDPAQQKQKGEILPEKSVLIVTSKIISLCQGRVVKMGSIDKEELIKQESNYFLPSSLSRYQVSFTLTSNMLVPSAGIDESNGDGNYILWPKDPQAEANKIREYLARRLKLRDVGVIITDSRTAPLRWGVTAAAIAYSGFYPLKDYIGQPDLYGRPFLFEKLHSADSLAAAAGIVMGEGAEQTPMAIIADLPQIEFQHRNPTDAELQALRISLEDDLYAPLLTSVKWEKGLSPSR